MMNLPHCIWCRKASYFDPFIEFGKMNARRQSQALLDNIKQTRPERVQGILPSVLEWDEVQLAEIFKASCDHPPELHEHARMAGSKRCRHSIWDHTLDIVASIDLLSLQPSGGGIVKLFRPLPMTFGGMVMEGRL